MKGNRFRQVIVIAGNHDVTLQPSFYHRQVYAQPESYYAKAVQAFKASCTYLEDETCHLWTAESTTTRADDAAAAATATATTDDAATTTTTVQPLRVYGSPWSPEYGNWAFTKPTNQMDPLWQAIPTETDILITHGPPFQRGDKVAGPTHVGCPFLLAHVQERIQPRLHIFGHIHEERGWMGYDGRTLFLNASNVNLRYRPVQPCLVVDVPHDVTLPVRWVPPASPVSNHGEFLWWLQNQESTQFDNLVHHLQQLLRQGKTNDFTIDWDDIWDWTQPWTALSALPEIFCQLRMHRDKGLQDDLQSALRELYADSFAY